MVSLANSNRHTGGFFGFSDEQATLQSSASDDDLIVDHIQLVSGPEMTHHPIRITWALVLAEILYVALGVSAYIVPVFCPDKKCGEDSISLTLYIHGGMWFVLFLLDRIFQHKHNESRLKGYLDFYRRTKKIRGLPFMINSCANAVLVIVVKLLDNLCDDSDKCWIIGKSRFIQIPVTIECLVALVVLTFYLARVVKFNRKKALPDVTQEELMTSFVNSQSCVDVGYRNENYIDEVMEKQADMIRYLRTHAENLARRNLTLTEEISRLKEQRGNFNGHL